LTIAPRAGARIETRG